MHANWLTYYRIARELQELLDGASVEEVYSQEKNVIMLGFTARGGEFTLQCSCNPQMPFVQVLESAHRARKNSVDLFPQILGRSVSGVNIARNDRQIRFTLDDGSWLLLQMFSARANLFLADAGNRIAASFKHLVNTQDPSAILWIDPRTPMREAVTEMTASPVRDADSVETLVSALGFIKGPLKDLLRERLAGGGSTGASPFSVLVGIIDECDRGDAYIYEPAGQLPVFSLVPLDGVGAPRIEPASGIIDMHDRF